MKKRKNLVHKVEHQNYINIPVSTKFKKGGVTNFNTGLKKICLIEKDLKRITVNHSVYPLAAKGLVIFGKFQLGENREIFGLQGGCPFGEGFQI